VRQLHLLRIAQREGRGEHDGDDDSATHPQWVHSTQPVRSEVVHDLAGLDPLPAVRPSGRPAVPPAVRLSAKCCTSLHVARTASNLVKMPQNFGSSAKVLRKPPPALSVSDAPLDARSARQLRSMFSRLVDAMALSGIPDSLFPE
jgi:hypothetical protein